MKKIKAIPTKYGDITFRSKLEAEWARFFDSIYLRWAYEVEGYELPDGTWYLPDFWFPDCKTFFEVKGVMGEKDINKIHQLASSVACEGLMVIIGGVHIPNSIGLVYPFPSTTDSERCYDIWEKPDEENSIADYKDVLLVECSKCLQPYFSHINIDYTCRNCGFHNGNATFGTIIYQPEYKP